PLNLVLARRGSTLPLFRGARPPIQEQDDAPPNAPLPTPCGKRRRKHCGSAAENTAEAPPKTLRKRRRKHCGSAAENTAEAPPKTLRKRRRPGSLGVRAGRRRAPPRAQRGQSASSVDRMRIKATWLPKAKRHAGQRLRKA